MVTSSGHRHRWWPPRPKHPSSNEVTTDVAVGQMRQMEFLADEEGDWAFHCHKATTHERDGHAVPTMIGVDHSGLRVKKITKLVPTTWSWANAGWRT